MIRKKLQRYTDEVHRRFIENYEVTGQISTAAKAAGVSLDTIYKQKKIHPTLVEEMEIAHHKYCDSMENEMRRRAIEGVVEDVYYQGEVVGTKRVYSDKMLETLMKKERPDAFRERKEISGAGGGPLEINIVQFDATTNKPQPTEVLDAQSRRTEAIETKEEKETQEHNPEKEESEDEVTVEIDPMTKILGKLGLMDE